jgi:hypothetical protein
MMEMQNKLSPYTIGNQQQNNRQLVLVFIKMANENRKARSILKDRKKL